MKRIIFITTFIALTFGLIFIGGCPRPTCKRGSWPKAIRISYINLPGGKQDTTRKRYPISVIITQRNNINNVIDTINKTIHSDSMVYLSFVLYFEGSNSDPYLNSRPIIYLPEDNWKPRNVIIIVDSTKYRDSLTNIVFYNDPKNNCRPDDPTGVSFYHNGKYVYLPYPPDLEIK